jgi:aconitate hydratase A / 2-methylisocitrate dehydratase
MSKDSFGARATLSVGGRNLTIHKLEALEKRGFSLSRLPYSIKVMLENVLRREDGHVVTAEQIEALARWQPKPPRKEFAFMPARVLLQDFTGVPVVADLAAMRDGIRRLGVDPAKINPIQPADLVIDHSVQVDAFGSTDAFRINAEMEFNRNRERYLFLRWGQRAFDNFRVVPPDTGIVHQVNLEYLAHVVFIAGDAAYPDTVLGTDSHTTMVNGMGVVGWGVGGIEAEAAMLGRSMPMLVPEVIGVRLSGALRSGATATDLVLTITQMLRKKGVVNKFVEYFGPGLDSLPVADRATLGNMSPEYGATIGFFPVDEMTLRYLRLTGRSEEAIKLIEAYCKAQGLFRAANSPEPIFSDVLELDLASIEPSLAGPRRPQDRVALATAKLEFRRELAKEVANHDSIDATVAERWVAEGGNPNVAPHDRIPASQLGELGSAVEVQSVEGARFSLGHGAVIIAAITSCTNTSNPSVMLAAGILAKKAIERGLRVRPWVKTSLAPGSKVVTQYLNRAGLTQYLEQLRFNLVGYGCTTCIGNSGPIAEGIAAAVKQGKLVACAVLSGNRNFEGRINPVVRFNYLASPPLVVAYAIAGTMDLDLDREPLATDAKGNPVYLHDIWPTPAEVEAAVRGSIDSAMFRSEYAKVFEGDDRWRSLAIPEGALFKWVEDSTYVKRPPFVDEITPDLPPMRDIAGARLLALLGDSVTTDHISPAGSIAPDSPAGKYLIAKGVQPRDFNSYGSRRGNHEVMVRGTFANIRLKNLMVPGVEGGFTVHLPDGERTTIFEASERYRKEGVPLIVIAGKEYGSGSSRDWAAKGPQLLGVRAVIAESFERIHRSNLVGMGILPLEFTDGQSRESLGLSGREVYSIGPLANGVKVGQHLKVRAEEDGKAREFEVIARIDTPEEVDYIRHGGILPCVLRELARS